MQITINQAASCVLDHLMNDPGIQQIMSQFISKMYPEQLPTGTEPPEDSPYFSLYYAATVEFHSKVLAGAIMGLCQDSLQ